MGVQKDPAPPKFLADDMVRRLGRWLRVVGYDTAIWEVGSDEEMIALARAEGRRIVTRDTRLQAKAPDLEVCIVQSDNPTEQLVEVARRWRLDLDAYRFTRCQRCNGLLEPVEKERYREAIPRQSYEAFDEFRRCRGCGQLYWPGDHYDSMQRTLAWVSEQLGGES